MRKRITRIEPHARNADGWQPHDYGVFHALPERMRRNKRSKIISPVGHYGPAIIPAGSKHIDLVAATRSLLGFPDGAGVRIDGESVTVSVTHGEDPGLESRSVGEGIVIRNAAV